MNWFYRGFTSGMQRVDTRPDAAWRECAHVIRTAARKHAAATYRHEHADDADAAQMRLDADQAGQRAYWETLKQPPGKDPAWPA